MSTINRIRFLLVAIIIVCAGILTIMFTDPGISDAKRVEAIQELYPSAIILTAPQYQGYTDWVVIDTVGRYDYYVTMKQTRRWSTRITKIKRLQVMPITDLNNRLI